MYIPKGIALASQSDLTVPTLAKNYAYKLGTIIEAEDSDNIGVVCKFMYVKSHAALTAYQPYEIAYSVSGTEVITAAPLTCAAPGVQVCVPQVAFTSGYYGFVLIQGTGKALMTTETYALGDILQLVTTASTLVVDGSTGATTLSTGNACGVCREAGSTAVARKVYLIGNMAVIAAS